MSIYEKYYYIKPNRSKLHEAAATLDYHYVSKLLNNLPQHLIDAQDKYNSNCTALHYVIMF
ncbi:MAG: hypothetical protein LN573_02600 [Rickettsia endosymbiont of Oxypoda opaca]|nr:hypothetical protein [Rickettsia endosymbiont of Oxypoda opaca]